MTTHCPTCDRSIDDLLIHSTPVSPEALKVTETQWHADLAALVAVLHDLMAEDDARIARLEAAGGYRSADRKRHLRSVA